VGLAEALRPRRQAGGLAGVSLPGPPVLHHGSLDWVKTHAAGIARAVGITQSAIGRSRPRKKLAPAPFGLAPPAPALGHQGPLVLGHGGADVSQEVIRRIITHRPLDTRDATATLGACGDHAPLRHRVTREALRRRHQHACQGGHRRPVSESVKTGTLERGAAGAVIALAVLVCNRPLRLACHGGVQAAEWWRNRLLLVLTTGRDTPGERDCHGTPPDGSSPPTLSKSFPATLSYY
jgi:hypothetical protein